MRRDLETKMRKLLINVSGIMESALNGLAKEAMIILREKKTRVRERLKRATKLEKESEEELKTQEEIDELLKRVEGLEEEPGR